MLLLTATAAPENMPVLIKAEAKSVAQYQSELDAAKSKANQLKAQINELKKKNAPYEAQKKALVYHLVNFYRYYVPRKSYNYL